MIRIYAFFSATLFLFISLDAVTYTDTDGNVSNYYSIYGYTDTAGTIPMNSGGGDPLDPGSPSVRETLSLNSAVFSVDDGPAGTGTFASFLRIQERTKERGMNADAISSQAKNHEKTDNTSTHDVRLSEVPINDLTGSDYSGLGLWGGSYLEIRFDMNEDQNGSLPQWSIFTEIQFWVSETPITSPYLYDVSGTSDDGHPDATNRDGDSNPNTSSLGTLVWDLDAGEDRSLGIYQSNSGSGSSDMIFYIPFDSFGGLSSDSYLTMWTELDDTDQAGFEEFSMIDLSKTNSGVTFIEPGTTIIPEFSVASLSSYALLGIMICASIVQVCFRRRKRVDRQQF